MKTRLQTPAIAIMQAEVLANAKRRAERAAAALDAANAANKAANNALADAMLGSVVAERRRRFRARRKARHAIKNGTLVRGPCEECGSTDNVHAHHEDYSKPLEVKWLCYTHHMEAHGVILRSNK